jgi:hypothetical protein
MKRLRINLLKWFEAAQRAGAIRDRRKEFIGTMITLAWKREPE